MLAPILLSLKVASIATIFAFLLGIFFARILTHKNVPFKDVWETLLILPMILPPSVVGYLLMVLFGKRGPIGAFLLDTFGIQVVFTWVACVIAACVVALPLMYQNAKAAFIALDPMYEEVAQTLGCGRIRTFWSITIPLCGPGITSGIVLTFARALGEFGATLMLAGNIPGRTQTVPTAIYYSVAAGRTEEANVLVLIMTLFSFVLIFSLNRWLKKNNYMGKQL